MFRAALIPASEVSNPRQPLTAAETAQSQPRHLMICLAGGLDGEELMM